MKKMLLAVIVFAVCVSLYLSMGEKEVIVANPVVDPSFDKNINASKNIQKDNPTEIIPEFRKTNSTNNKLAPELKRALEAMLNTSSEGLVEVKTAKGVEVKLQGRFQTVPVAIINDKGEVEIQDYTSAPKQKAAQ